MGADTSPAAPASGFGRLLERAQQEVLTVSFWSPDGLADQADSVVVRLRGRRSGISGRPGPGDQFVREEVVDGLPPGSGPFTVTSRVTGVEPGEWRVSAEMVAAPRGSGGGRGASRRGRPLELAAWSWWRRTLTSGPDAPVRTGLVAFAPRPGVIVGIWPAMLALAIAVSLVLQGRLLAREDLPVGSALWLSAVAVGAGAIGAKAWYVVLQRPRQWDGWCIQGFVAAASLVAVVLTPVAGLPLGAFLDLTTPGLFAGLAIGRVGCFFAGCCGGRPTCSRLGVWSSDRRIGVRRVPTQLLEVGLATVIALVALAAAVVAGPAGGLLFTAALAGYTLFRQGLLRFRAVGRRTSMGSRLTAAAAALTLVLAGAGIVMS